LLIMEWVNLTFEERRKKRDKLLLSRRYNSLPLLRSHPGGVQEELAVKDLSRRKDRKRVCLRLINC